MNLSHRAYEKLKSWSKKHRELGRSGFWVVSADSIQMQPMGNDLYGFYVMHYMHSLINALFGSQVWPLGPFSKLGWPCDVLRVFSKAFLNCVSPFSCVPDWSVIYIRADWFGDIWVPRRSFRFHYRPSREHQGSPSPSLIKVLVF